LLLRQRGIPYVERTVEGPDDADELRRQTGAERVPVLTLGGERLIGFGAAKWTRSLDLAGYPGESRLPAGYLGSPPQPLVARASGPAQRVGPAPAAR
jgi:hypothetical protein